MGKNNKFIIQARNIFKQFDGVQALKGIDFELEYNDIHALVGENGAGKSTFSKILAGVHRFDLGEIFFEKLPYLPRDRKEAADCGIFIIYQELNIVPSLNVAENLFLGRLQTFKNKIGFLDYQRLYRESEKWLKRMNLDISPKSSILDLSLGQMKLIEMAKAISSNLKVLIIDEATAVLNKEETEILFDQINILRQKGKSVIYISHNLEEIFKICSKVSVLKDGKMVDTMLINQVNKDKLSQMMVGRKVKFGYYRDNSKKGKYSKEIILKVNELSEARKFLNVSFELHPGEIFGIGGLVGSGKEELAETLFGIRRGFSGKIIINNTIQQNYSILKAISSGVAYIPKDRDSEGLITIFSISKNIILPILEKIKEGFVLKYKREKEISINYFRKLKILAKDIKTICSTLSGGNRQKVVLAKWLASNPKVLIMNNPTRGIDVGVKSEIYKLMDKLAESGAAILLISDELQELIGLSDHLLIMRKGKVAATFNSQIDNITEEAIIRCMV